MFGPRADLSAALRTNQVRVSTLTPSFAPTCSVSPSPTFLTIGPDAVAAGAAAGVSLAAALDPPPGESEDSALPHAARAMPAMRLIAMKCTLRPSINPRIRLPQGEAK